MLLAHLVAAALTLWGLRRGEVAVVGLLDLLRLLAQRAAPSVPLVTTPTAPPAVPVVVITAPVHGRRHHAVPRLRGPPSAAA